MTGYSPGHLTLPASIVPPSSQRSRVDTDKRLTNRTISSKFSPSSPLRPTHLPRAASLACLYPPTSSYPRLRAMTLADNQKVLGNGGGKGGSGPIRGRAGIIVWLLRTAVKVQQVSRGAVSVVGAA